MVSVRVMALNVWGMPAKVGSEDKELRIKVIFTVMILFCGEGARVWQILTIAADSSQLKARQSEKHALLATHV